MQANAQANLVVALWPLVDDDGRTEIINTLINGADTDERHKDLFAALLPLLNDDTYHKLMINKFCTLEPWRHGHMRDIVLENIRTVYTCARERTTIFRRFPEEFTFPHPLVAGINEVEVTRPAHPKVVAKVLTKPAEIASFYWTELTILSFLSHPNIVTCYGGAIQHAAVHPRTNKRLILGKWIKFDLIKQMVEGLSYLHRFRICHRDIKPSNVMIKECAEAPLGWQLKLIDVGVSRAVDASNTVTFDSGTEAYMPPEVRECRRNQRGHPEARLEGDVFSLGLVIRDLWSETLRSTTIARDQRPCDSRMPAPPALEQLLQQCESNALDRRPSAERAREMVLQAESQSRRSRCTIKTHAGKYVCADIADDTGSEELSYNVIGNRDQAAEWERWEVTEVGVPGEVSLKSFHGFYLSVWAHSSMSERTAQETFKVVELEDNRVHLMTHHDQYLTVEPTTLKIRARLGPPGTPETFEFIHEAFIEA